MKIRSSNLECYTQTEGRTEDMAKLIRPFLQLFVANAQKMDVLSDLLRNENKGI
jgi:hypothetical protein